MAFAEKYFGKNIFDINESDVISFFQTAREEDESLEFKSGQVEIHDIFKEICAFLNTNGGLLIIGTPQETKKGAKRFCIGNPTPSHFSDKEWLNQNIRNNIVPLADHIFIHEINNNKGNIYLLEIPPSNLSPHQCLNDGRYYIRVKEEARPAPHQTIRTLFFKKHKAMPKSKIRFHEIPQRLEPTLNIAIEIYNNSLVPSNEIAFKIELINIRSVIQNVNSYSQDFENVNNVFVLEKKINQDLFDELKLPLSFSVLHKNQPFLLSVLTWNKDTGIHKNRILYDPVNDAILEDYNSDYDTKEKDKAYFQNILEKMNNI